MVVWHLIYDEKVAVNNIQKPNLPARMFYNYYNIDANDFSVILLGKDGGEKLRKKSFVSAAELFSLIDAMPMRQQEIREGRN